MLSLGAIAVISVTAGYYAAVLVGSPATRQLTEIIQNPDSMIRVQSVQKIHELLPGEVATGEFILTNKTNGDVGVKIGRTSCTCIDAQLDVDIIPVGGDARVTIETSPGDNSPSRATVEILCSTHFTGTQPVQSNQKPESIILNFARSQGRRDLGLSPTMIQFGSFSPGMKEREAQFKLILAENVKQSVVSEMSVNDEEDEQVSLRVGKPFRDSQGRLVYEGAAIWKPFDQQVGFHTERQISANARLAVMVDGVRRLFDLKIQGTQVPQITATPSALFWSKRSQETMHQLKLESSAGKPIGVVDVKSYGVPVHCKVLQDKPGSVTIEVNYLLEESADGPLRGELVLVVNCEESQPIDIKVPMIAI
jgi:hypothetical protein